ncbi:RidA family protein [Sphingosinicella terrae]|uniref:RidA family protein n=1 Tax=Sphingosinicella terrae TaxID=2172047 RepID=UPI0025479FEF|nr:RidA family protein [Sphingosinicella terrae]
MGAWPTNPPRNAEGDRPAQGRREGEAAFLPVTASDAPTPAGGYSQAVRLINPSEILFVSGQVPVDLDGKTPADFAGQCRLVWRNVVAQLRAGGFGLDDIAKVTTYLANRDDAEENGAIRREILGERAPALTVIIATIFDPAWLLEIEVVAAKGVS